MPSPDTAASAIVCRSASSNFGSARERSSASRRLRRAASSSTQSSSLASSSLRNFWLSVTRGSARLALTSVSCTRLPARDALDWHDEQVVVAHERHVGFAARPPRARFSARRPGDVDPLAVHGIDDDDVAAIDAENAPARGIPLPVGERRAAPIGFRQAPQPGAVPRHHPRGRADPPSASAIRSRAPSNRRTIAGCSADCRPAQARA